ncbi:phosphoribosylglycinamide synthetase C domain-containing protein [Bacillus sp. JCM 19041]|uniref:phosphoribosylglycinamide synthetase C domain-containing protein n=1 Tax=Bacillus sp. JCM 19041 TaxID=1460637 RepID=UPI003369E76E
MMTTEGPKVIEFNARFGDPETQVVLPRLKSDLIDVMLQMLSGERVELEWTDQAVVGVVHASVGYPEAYAKGVAINGIEAATSEALVFHAGTKKAAGEWQTNGGRVLLVASTGGTIKEAQSAAYEASAKIESDGLYYRKDIAEKAMQSAR